jgi:sugar phosphate isomerase/epimerase
MNLTRREFARAGGLAAAGARLLAAPQTPPRAAPVICLFSKRLAKVHYSELGGVLSDLGFEGCDLTVRPGGHVEPSLAAADLYRAVEAIRAEGVDVPVITTALTSARDPTAVPVLALSGRMKVPYFRLGYWLYRAGDDIETRLEEVRQEAAGLAAMGRAYGMTACFQNRSGDYVGEAVWDIREVIKGTDPQWMGYYFDPCHATIEGGLEGWKIALRLAMPRIKVVAVKDFVWSQAGGKWNVQFCPLGQGMVNWPEVFAMLAEARFTGPMSLHVEYEARDDLAAIARDLAFLKKHVAPPPRT